MTIEAYRFTVRLNELLTRLADDLSRSNETHKVERLPEYGPACTAHHKTRVNHEDPKP